jgi:Flp pilus assembly protein TadD
MLSIAACKSKSDIATDLSYDQYIKLARQHYDKNDIDSAIAAYNKDLTIKPDDSKTHFLLGKIYQSEWDKSYQSATQKKIIYVLNNTNIRYDNDNSDETLGKFGLKVGYDKLAIDRFRETIKYDPANWEARHYIATDLFNKKQYLQAIDEFNKVVAANPKNGNALTLLGAAYAEVGSYDLAIKSYKQAYHINRDVEFYYFNLGKVYYRMDNIPKAAEMFKKLREMKSQYSERLIDFKNILGK